MTSSLLFKSTQKSYNSIQTVIKLKFFEFKLSFMKNFST